MSNRMYGIIKSLVESNVDELDTKLKRMGESILHLLSLHILIF